MAVVCHFAGTVDDYRQTWEVWVVAARPAQCPHCGRAHTSVLWASYQRYVCTTTDRVCIRIQRIRCRICGVTDALLPSFLHLFRRYVLALIHRALLLALAGGRWGLDLAKAIGPYDRPVPTTVWEWVWSFGRSAEHWLLAWLQGQLTTLDPLTPLDPGPPPAHLAAIRSPRRQAAFRAGWQALRLAEVLYALTRTHQPGLVFQADQLLAFLAAARGTAGWSPRLLWPQAPPAPPKRPSQSGRPPAPAMPPSDPRTSTQFCVDRTKGPGYTTGEI